MSTIKLVTEIPGPRSRALVARREAATARGSAKLTGIAVDYARGAAVTDLDGNTFIDLAGGIGTLAVGHCAPEVVEVIQQQVEKLIHMCAIVSTDEPFVQVAELLNEIAPGDFAKKTVLASTGAEAVETAVKIARSYTKRPGIIVFEGAFHGRSNMTLSMTSKYALFKKGFGPFAPEVHRLPFPNVYRTPEGMDSESYVEYACQQLEHALIAQVDPEAVAAIVIEPVQGEGGFLPTPARFLERIRQLCDQYGMMMIADEIQCGMGRTGKIFAIEHYGIAPDLITTAKSLAAGMPLSAVIGRAEVMDAPHPGGLGGTYSGNPLACVAAIEAIKMIREPAFLQRATEVGQRIRQHLEAIQADTPLVGDVRGLGAMLAMELVQDRASKAPAPEQTSQVTVETLQRGVITIRAGLYSNCVRFLPPLVITNEQIDEAMTVLKESVGVVAAAYQPARA